MVKKSVKEQALNGFYSGMSKADNSEPQVNLLINGCMMMVGVFAFAYVALHGPELMFLRIALLFGCVIMTVTGFRNFRMWGRKIRDFKGDGLASIISNELIEKKDEKNN